ncbi:MAG TPA: hypothetical protein VD865_06185 [Stenotrophomonas sp.]|nr:hypothetical protein [Stenotrophomonas sp.]
MDTPIDLAYARAYALLRAAGASDQATFDIVFSRAHGELLASFPDQQTQIIATLLGFSRQLGRATGWRGAGAVGAAASLPADV